MKNIRNFVIIAHIDHGKSTLADRLLEVTNTVNSRKMHAQYLDNLELEQERGITIKMAPVRMNYNEYILNLIDTPGHPDFSYEVSRALAAVEGAILLVDGTQGIQAQTLSNYYSAKKENLVIVGAVNKIDMPTPEIDNTISELSKLIGQPKESIHKISAKTGFGVKELLDDVIKNIPAPEDLKYATRNLDTKNISRAMIFDSFYDDHKGIIASVRVFNGKFKEGDHVMFAMAKNKAIIKEVGIFSPKLKNVDSIEAGEIGYIITGVKDTDKVKIGDTIISVLQNRVSSNESALLSLPGYKEPRPVVFVSFFPDREGDFNDLKKALERLRLNDSAFTFEPDFNEVLGRGFKGGFLGKLHFEIILQRLEREFNIMTTTSFPSVEYKVKTDSVMSAGVHKDNDGYYLVRNPNDFPKEFDEVLEPMIRTKIICSNDLLGRVMQLQEIFRWDNMETENFSDRVIIKVRMPLAELISDFDDKIKSVSGGFASFSYEDDGYEKADVVKMDVLVAGDIVPGLSKIVIRKSLEYEARILAKKLKSVLPKQQFTQAIQVRALGRIVARETLTALSKNVTGYLYGGDITRKMKLWKKQKKGKKKLKERASVRISANDFKKLMTK